MRGNDKTTCIVMNKKYLKMIQDKWKEINTKPVTREIEIIYVKCEGLTYHICYSDKVAIYHMEIKSKCFFKRLVNHWIENKKIEIKDNDWLVLVNEKNKTI